jgi:hypothetical protein
LKHVRLSKRCVGSRFADPFAGAELGGLSPQQTNIGCVVREALEAEIPVREWRIETPFGLGTLGVLKAVLNSRMAAGAATMPSGRQICAIG